MSYRAGALVPRDFGFTHLDASMRGNLARWVARARRWSVVYSDIESSTWLRLSCAAAGAKYVRTIPWIRWSMPAIQGDRPPAGCEQLLLFHGRTPLHWNGPGCLTHFAHLALRNANKHPAEKPLDQALDLVSYFSDVGEHIFDPFAGAGTIGLACRILDRRYTGAEIDEKWSRFAAERIGGELRDKDARRVERWIKAKVEPVVQSNGAASNRAALRRADKLRAIEFLRARRR